MSDSFSQIFDEPLRSAAMPSQPMCPDWFDETAYLAANPDVAAAVIKGELPSGYDHYRTIGYQENRALCEPGTEPRGRLLRTISNVTATIVTQKELRLNIDAILISKAGGVMVVGWIDDTAAPLDYLGVAATGWNYTFDASSIIRIRRLDVETALGSSRMHLFGFIAFAFLDTSFAVRGSCAISIGTKDGASTVATSSPRQVDDVEMRRVVLSYVADSDFFGNRQVEAMHVLDGPIGPQIINHNLHITQNVVAGAYAERFGQRTKSPRGSIVVCLYGKPEYLFLQNALFAGGPGFEDYELIYVSNTPEMAERLLKEANAAHRIYGLPQTVVLLPGNAGFGAANNVAVQYAQSDRILIVNPDVFPRDANWALKHSQAIENLPEHQTRLFGAPLYYDDGTLMHGGMYFEFDKGISLSSTQVVQRRMLRVEHYGKGAPLWAEQFTRSRPVQAVTGAFISVERAWYERLGGFTENYVFGHYEDADLCLKSIAAGCVPWIHDIRLWHLEGKGSVRLPVHEGGSLVNRWLFTKTWSDTVSDGLEGPKPTHPVVQMPSPMEPIRQIAASAMAVQTHAVDAAASVLLGAGLPSADINMSTATIDRTPKRPARKNIR